MIGVSVQEKESATVQEFFEFFKTPWEFYRSGRLYDVVISTQDHRVEEGAKLVLLYSGGPMGFDADNNLSVRPGPKGAILSYNGRRVPLYARAATFPASRFSDLREEVGQEPMGLLVSFGRTTVLRVGYDLFEEIRFLLSVGQPIEHAGTASLELHIAAIRDLITRAGIPLVEIPPVPDGYGLMVCLTHDIDHPVLRNHCCDRTMFGFVYRATLGSFMHVCRGRKPLKNLGRNLAAVGRLPFVYIGLAKDPWREFDRYLEIETGLGSTYFVIPKKGYSGRGCKGANPTSRASGYTLDDIKPELARIISAGCEVALHGIDAWLDSASGEEERQELSSDLISTPTGVRMHWLFFDENSPKVLERGGFSYDSSVGYNETVGFRAGTAQAYKPPGATNLLELPLHVMDTALFFSDFLNLSDSSARQVVWRLLEDVAQFGGVLTVNWHDRSIAPERLWDKFYMELLRELKIRGAWFPTASQAVAWFRKRRSASFGQVEWGEDSVNLAASAKPGPGLPGLRLRVHQARARSLLEPIATDSKTSFVDVGFDTAVSTRIAWLGPDSHKIAC